jgi:uncharacterized protein YegJ (DUF2314 family)
LLKQATWRAFSRADAKTGKRIADNIAIMAITTNNSIKVKACDDVLQCVLRISDVSLDNIQFKGVLLQKQIAKHQEFKIILIKIDPL